MATEKIYKISIELDQARAQLDDAAKRLAKMETQLKGLSEIDQKGSFGKAIREAIISTQAEIDKLSGKIGGLAGKLGEVGAAAPGSVGALRQEVVALEAAFEQGMLGSAELGATITQLADKKSQLRELANTVNALNPRQQARAFTVFGGAVVGAFSIATVAAQTFGLSSEKAQEYQAKLQGLITVLYSVEAVNKALNGENVALIKSVIASGRAYLAAGEAASTGSKVTRAALISSGIGILVLALAVVLAVVVENWDKLTNSVKGSLGFFTQVKAVTSGLFDGIIQQVKILFGVLGDLVTLDFSGAVKRARGAGKEVADAYAKGYAESVRASNRDAVALQIEAQARRIELAKAQGKETLQLEIENAQRKLDNMATETKEQKKAAADQQLELDKLKAQQLGESFKKEDAQAIQHAQAQAQLLAAKGREAFTAELTTKQEELSRMRSLLTRNDEAEQAKADEIAAFQAAHAKQLNDQEKAALLAQLDARIALVQAKGLETYNLQLAREQAALKILQDAGIRNEAEITAQLGRVASLRAARTKDQNDKANAAEIANLQAVVALENAQGADSYEAQVKVEEKKLQLLKSAGIKNQQAIIDQQSKLDTLAATHARKEEQDGRALSIARTQVKIALATAQDQETTALEVELKQKELAALEAQLDRNESAITLKKGELLALQYEQERKAADERRALLEEEQGYKLALLQKQGKDTLAIEIANARALIALDTDTSAKGLKQKRADIAALDLLLEEQKQRPADLGVDILAAFGVKPEDVLKVKAAITQAVSEVNASLQQLASSFLDGAIQAADQQLAAVQGRAQLIDQQLQASQSGADKSLAEVEKSTGARRDFYLQQLERERAKTEQLQAAKRKAAEEEKRLTKEKHALERQGQEIAAASALATNIATAASAVYTGIKAVSGAAALPFPASLPAMAATLTAVVGLVAGAKGLSNATKFADGGVIEGGSHASGNDVPILGGRYRVEGGEGILPVQATQNNRAAFELMRTAGRSRVLTLADFARIGNVRVLPPPIRSFGDGGVVPGTSLPAGMVAVAQADLSALIALTQQVVAHTSATAGHTKEVRDFGPPITVYNESASIKRREVDQRADDSKAAVRLG